MVLANPFRKFNRPGDSYSYRRVHFASSVCYCQGHNVAFSRNVCSHSQPHWQLLRSPAIIHRKFAFQLQHVIFDVFVIMATGENTPTCSAEIGVFSLKLGKIAFLLSYVFGKRWLDINPHPLPNPDPPSAVLQFFRE